ncbi:MAG: BON domain-containing protein [Candidatus Acidiferrales bacterium]
MRIQIRKCAVVVLCAAALAASPSAFAQEKTRAEGAKTAAINIAKEVRHELVMLPYYSVFDNLEYRVENYTVYLTGQVTRPTLKSDAEARVKGIEGVERVVNQIEVLPVSNHDDRIRLATYRAIFGHSGMHRYAIQSVPPIHIIVKNGHVRLVGVVANEADKNIANIQARSVPGAFSVENELRVEGRDDD